MMAKKKAFYNITADDHGQAVGDRQQIAACAVI